MSDRIRELVSRLSAEDRAAILSGFGCTDLELAPRDRQPRKERKRPAAPPHPYRPCRITDEQGTFVRCGKRDCQDDAHRVRAALS